MMSDVMSLGLGLGLGPSLAAFKLRLLHVIFRPLMMT